MSSRILFIFLLLYSSFSSAATYWWASPFSNGTHFPDAPSACAAWPSWQGTYQIELSGNSASCDGRANLATRNGDSCQAGAIYDEKTGACNLPKQKDGELCDDQAGHGPSNPMIFSTSSNKCVALTDADDKATCGFFGGKGETTYTVSGVLSSGGEAVAPPTFAGQMGCEVATISTSECTVNVKGAISCNVTAKFTGNVAKSPGPSVLDSQCDPNTCPPQEKSTSINDKPCVMSNGACTSETDTQTTGTQSCGSFNGNYVCSTSKPTSNGTKIDTTVKSEVQSDGSVKTTRTDNATKTSCTDVNTCTLKNSTTTTTTTTNKAGQTTSTTSTCFGTCGSGGQGLGSSGGSGNGNGDGDGEGDGTASSSADCKVPPPCDGDAYLCAILRQEALDSCAERALPTDKEKADFNKIMDKVHDDADANQKELDSKVTSLVTQFQSESGSGGSTGKCFEDQSFTIPVVNKTLVLPFSEVCGILEWFRYAVIAVAFLASLYMIRTEL